MQDGAKIIETRGIGAPECNVQTQAFRGLLVPPPAGLWARLKFYSTRYGVIHSLCRYAFAHWRLRGWQLVGPRVTRGHREKWLAESPQRILNLGGGGNCLVGCLTVDIDPTADCFVDLRRPLPFEDSTIDAIFCEEAIEHIFKDEGERLLMECFRVIRPGGFIRITTPDLDYLAARLNLDENGSDQINQMFYEHGHRYLYSRRQLKEACQRAGFREFTWSAYRDPASFLGHLDTHADRFEHPPELAQFAEMRKPK